MFGGGGVTVRSLPDHLLAAAHAQVHQPTQAALQACAACQEEEEEGVVDGLAQPC